MTSSRAGSLPGHVSSKGKRKPAGGTLAQLDSEHASDGDTDDQPNSNEADHKDDA